MKNIKYIVLVGFYLCAWACTNTKMPTVECEEYDIEPNIKECITDKEPIPGFEIGEVIAYSGLNKMEKNMLSQFGSYNLALLRGDIDNACRYQYPDAVSYFKKFYPDETNDAIMRSFFASMSKEMVSTIQRYEEHGIELNIVVSRIIRKVTQGDNIIYVFEVVGNLVSDKLQMHALPDATIAISTNGGKNWTFNTVNEDTPNILRVSYSDEVIDKVMGY